MTIKKRYLVAYFWTDPDTGRACHNVGHYWASENEALIEINELRQIWPECQFTIRDLLQEYGQNEN